MGSNQSINSQTSQPITTQTKLDPKCALYKMLEEQDELYDAYKKSGGKRIKCTVSMLAISAKA
jgi:hypothetical protein